MSHASITVAEGLTMADYRVVGDCLGSPPGDGLVSEAAGENDNGLHVITVWDSKAHHDRFVTERLIPAFAAAGVRPGAMTFTDVPLDALYVRAGGTSER
jgi:hypothetical protein